MTDQARTFENPFVCFEKQLPNDISMIFDHRLKLYFLVIFIYRLI